MSLPNTTAKSGLLTIWTEPRLTVRRRIDGDPSRGVVGLSIVAGVSIVFGVAALLGFVRRDTLPGLASAALIDGSILGLVSVFFAARMLAWSGQAFLSGHATEQEIRTALAWTGATLPWLAGLAVLRASCERAPAAFIPAVRPFVTDAVTWALAIFALWAFVVHLKTLGEAHGFSLLRALACVLIAMTALVLILAVPVGSLALILTLV